MATVNIFVDPRKFFHTLLFHIPEILIFFLALLSSIFSLSFMFKKII